MSAKWKIKGKVTKAGSSVVRDGPIANMQIANSSIKEWSDGESSGDRPWVGGKRVGLDIGTGSRR